METQTWVQYQHDILWRCKLSRYFFYLDFHIYWLFFIASVHLHLNFSSDKKLGLHSLKYLTETGFNKIVFPTDASVPRELLDIFEKIQRRIFVQVLNTSCSKKNKFRRALTKDFLNKYQVIWTALRDRGRSFTFRHNQPHKFSAIIQLSELEEARILIHDVSLNSQKLPQYYWLSIAVALTPGGGLPYKMDGDARRKFWI